MNRSEISVSTPFVSNMSIITAYAKVTISNGGQDLATVDLLLLELHKAFRYKDKTYTLFVHKFNSPNAHKGFYLLPKIDIFKLLLQETWED